MCLLAILSRVVDGSPLLVAANREEAFARQGTMPRLQGDPVEFVGGVDPVAGGTWLGLNQHGLLVAVTNGRSHEPPAQPRSRGLLVRDLLACPDVPTASALALKEWETGRYAPCNLLLADGDRLQVVHCAPWLRVIPLPPGVYVLTNGNVNSDNDERVGYALRWLGQRFLACADVAVTQLKQLCALNGSDGQPPLTLRGTDRGTVSSAIIVRREPLQASQWWHCQGAPDQHPYQDVSHLIRQME
jgi:uncharacterized protein with NRDE domain